MLECDYNDHNQKNQCKNNPKPKLQVVCEYPVNTRIHKKNAANTPKKSAKSVHFRTFTLPHLLSQIIRRDGFAAKDRVGPGGGGGGLRPVHYLRGGGR